jgi:glycosyltransferase involved in cell wall biosynthesis
MLRIGVDAANFPGDRRGMGRVARGVLAVARASGDVAIELISLRRNNDAALAAEFGDLPLQRPAQAARCGAYDVVWYPWNGMRFRSAAPALVTINDTFAFEEPHRDSIARWREQAPIRRAVRDATRISTISHWSRERLIHVLDVAPERIAVIHPAPDPFFVPGDDAGIPASLAGKRYVLLVGAREPRKNARVLLAAASRALRTPAETLAVVGGLTPEDERFAKGLALTTHVIDVDDALLRALYRNAAVVAVPSSAEGYGLVAVEAMACGAPVLAADAAALPEATAGAAELLPPADIEAWSRALRRVLDEPAHAAMLRAAGLARIAASDRSEPALRFLGLLREVADAGPR